MIEVVERDKNSKARYLDSIGLRNDEGGPPARSYLA